MNTGHGPMGADALLPKEMAGMAEHIGAGNTRLPFLNLLVLVILVGTLHWFVYMRGGRGHH